MKLDVERNGVWVRPAGGKEGSRMPSDDTTERFALSVGSVHILPGADSRLNARGFSNVRVGSNAMSAQMSVLGAPDQSWVSSWLRVSR